MEGWGLRVEGLESQAKVNIARSRRSNVQCLGFRFGNVAEATGERFQGVGFRFGFKL